MNAFHAAFRMLQGRRAFTKLSVFIVFAALASNGLAEVGKSIPAKMHQSNRIESFLNYVMRADSLEDLGRMAKKSGFTEMEKRKIEQALKRTPYASKLEQLKRKAPEKTHSKAKVKEKTRQLNQALKQRQDRQLKRRNQEAVNLLSTLKQNRVARTNPTSRLNTVSAPMRMTMPARGKNTGSSASITRITPSYATVGQDITITGNGFGDSRARITIIIGDYYLWFQEIAQWTDTRIVATIPYQRVSGGVRYAGVEPAVGTSPKEAIIWVQPNYRTGPYAEITVAPDPASLEPVISSLSSLEIRPGQRLVIRGEHFLEESAGTVKFFYPSGTGTANTDGIVSQWQDSYVYVEFPGTPRWLVSEGDGSVALTNHAGRSCSRSLRYRPNLVIRELYRASDSVRADLIIGYRETHTDHDFVLINGWKVEDYELDYTGGGFGYGAVYIRRPRGGDTYAGSTVEVWADLFSHCTYYNYLWIIGPEGWPHR